MPDKSLCIIPARGGSKRLPGKNIALFGGKPMIAYSIEVAKESGLFDTICVSSDDEKTLAIARQYNVEPLERPAELAGDDIQLYQVCKHLLEHFSLKGRKFSSFALLIPASPLRKVKDLLKAYEMLQSEDVNSVFSITPYSKSPLRASFIDGKYLKPYFAENASKGDQQLPQLYFHDGSFIFAETDAFLKAGGFYGPKVLPYVIPPGRSVNIDTPLDLAWAEFLLSRRKGM